MKARDDASASLVGIVVAVFVFGLTFAFLIQASIQQETPGALSEVSGLEATASVLARSLLRDAGEGWYGGAACADGELDRDAMDADAVARAGLGEERCAVGEGSAYHRLNYDKLENLRGADVETNATNGRLDYEEARASLGLDGTTTQFHLRSWPLFDSLERRVELALRDSNIRALYIGDYEQQQGAQTTNYLVQHTAGALDLGDRLLLYVHITNNGTATTAFSVTFTVPTDRPIVAEKHTSQLSSNADEIVTLSIHKTSDWSWTDPLDPAFEYTIRDPSKTVGGGRPLLALSMTGANDVPTLLVEASKLEHRLHGGSARLDFFYDAVNGTGDTGISYTGWTLRLRDPSGAIVETDADLRPRGGTSSFTVSAAGTYQAELLDANGLVAQSDYANVVASELGRFEPAAAPGEWVATDAVLPEATYLSTLLTQFQLAVPDDDFDSLDVPLHPDGDVFPDDNRFLSDQLPALLLDADGNGTTENYHVLVVGSNVDHNTLTSSIIKFTIEDWVEAGGTLVVLGSDEQAVQWMEPLFHTGLQLAGGGIGVPDPEHAVLTTPNQLDVVALDDHDTAWDFNRDEERALFTHVVTSGSEDILAVSNPGAFGAGRVVLTSWRAFDASIGDPPAACAPAGLTSGCPGLQVLDNFITLAYGALYIDYGPLIPDGTPVAIATDIGLVYAPTFARSIEVYVILYVF